MKKKLLITINILLIMLVASILIITNKNTNHNSNLLSFASEDIIDKYEIEYSRINILINVNDVENKSCVFSINNEKKQEAEIKNGICSYTFDNLKEDTVYNIKVILKDYYDREVEKINKEIKTLTNLAEHVKKLSNYSLDENGVYYHSSQLKLGAKDNSYRYAGKNEKINNWVCFGNNENPCSEDNLYRIIGIFDEENNGKYLIKLIAADYVNEEYLGTDGNRNTSKYEFNINNYYLGKKSKINTFFWLNENQKLQNDWQNSDLNKVNLNKNYYEKLGEWNKLIYNKFWQINGIMDYSETAQKIYNDEIQNYNDKIYNDEIGLMYISDYMYAASPKYWQIKSNEYSNAKDENWMYLGANEWTITKINDEDQGIVYINENGNVDKYIKSILSFAVRPVFYLNNNVGYTEGTGEKSNPYRISLFDNNIATVCRGQYLGDCFSKNSNLDSELYHHDGKIDYLNQKNAELEANDDSYRYAGANPHNFVCLDNEKKGSCNENNLFRIIGFFALENGTYAAKLIKNTAIGQREWNGDTSANTYNGWWDSDLYKNLNDATNSPLKNIFSYIIEDNWYVDSQSSDNMVHQIPQNVYKYEKYVTEVSGNSKMIVNSKIGLMYISDYMYAASPEAWTYIGDDYGTSRLDYSAAKDKNWLAGIDEYVITSASNNGNQAFYLQSGGKVGVCNLNVSHNIRPVFSLIPNAIVKSGIGIKTEPYRITVDKSDIDMSIDTNQVSNFSYVGDYQTFTAPVDGNYKVELWGASGSTQGSILANTFGRGAYTQGLINLKAGDKLYVYVGGWPYNGGGTGEAPGGGATDVRLTPGNWDNFNSLKSRIMVAAGGGGALYIYAQPTGDQRGDGETINGIDATYYPNYSGHGATQTSGGKPGTSFYPDIDPSCPEQTGKFGQGGYGVHAGGGGITSSGGGGGYYGGGHGNHPGDSWTGGGGGSSFISGYDGCNAIASGSTASNIIHTGQSAHYSGKVFTSAQMIAGNASMPSPAGGTEIGHTGTGYARITLIA